MRNRYLDTFQIAGFIISAVIAFVLLLAGEDTINSIVLGFVIAIFVQLFDVQMRQAESRDQIVRVNQIAESLLEDETLFSNVKTLVTDYQRIKSYRFVPFQERAVECLSECCSELHTLAEGRMIVQSDSRYVFGNRPIQFAERSIKAVSLADENFWNSDAGKRYLATNIQITRKKKLQFIRVFANTTANLKNMLDIMQEQEKQGIEVYVLQTDRLQKSDLEDCIVMDEIVANRAEFHPNGQVKYWILSIDKSEVTKIHSNVDMVIRKAKKLRDAILVDLK